MTCPKCKTEIVDDMIWCPECGRKLKHSSMDRIFAVIGLLAIIALNIWIIWYINVNI